MKYYTQISLIASIALLFSCSSSGEFELTPSTNLLPDASRLNKGVVSKFYIGDFRGEGKRDRADIEYRSLQLIDDNKLELIIYDPGFQPQSVSRIAWKNNQLILLEQYHLKAGDTIKTKIIQPVLFDPGGSAHVFNIVTPFKEDYILNTRDVLMGVTEITVEGKKGKSFEFISSLSNDALENGQSRNGQLTITYLDGLGLYSEETDLGNRVLQQFLIEQMSLEEFNKLANHNRNRVAYINPEDKIDTLQNFNPCDRQQKILDYYNTTPHAQFEGGNYQLSQLISNELNNDLLTNESGYLVLRFVINCKGEAGWFVTEMYDLDYQATTFKPELVNHLMNILISKGSWSQGNLNGEDRDAYAYVSFKFKDGQLIEILP